LDNLRGSPAKFCQVQSQKPGGQGQLRAIKDDTGAVTESSPHIHNNNIDNRLAPREQFKALLRLFVHNKDNVLSHQAIDEHTDTRNIPSYLSDAQISLLPNTQIYPLDQDIY